jgi:hypothetical protein
MVESDSGSAVRTALLACLTSHIVPKGYWRYRECRLVVVIEGSERLIFLQDSRLCCKDDECL